MADRSGGQRDDGALKGWETRRKNQARTREVFEAIGAKDERARLRPLLKRCFLELEYFKRETGQFRSDLLAELRRELDVDKDG